MATRKRKQEAVTVQRRLRRQRLEDVIEESTSSDVDEPTSHDQDTESDFQEPSTSTGRGNRGRGQGNRGRGRGRRGRGGTRGRRVFHGREFGEREADQFSELHLECRQRAEELVEQLSGEEARELLNEMCKQVPSVVLDISEIRSRNNEETPSTPPKDEGRVPDWCVCNHCTPMNTALERVCCEMRPDLCISLRPEMTLAIVHPFVLHLQQRFRNDIFARDAQTQQDINKAYRHSAYRQYILWVHGRLHRDDRRVVPSCCVKVIRDKYPDPNGRYRGFVPAYGAGW